MFKRFITKINKLKDNNDKTGTRPKLVCGFTIIETLIAITILLVVGAVSISSFLNWRSAKNIEVGADAVLSVLKEAKNLTVNGKGGDVYGVYVGNSDNILLFKGSSFNSSSVISTTSLPSNIIISTSTLGNSILFQKFSGNTSGDGIITLIDNSNASNTRTINIETSGSLFTK